jgi:hypothetical protein
MECDGRIRFVALVHYSVRVVHRRIESSLFLDRIKRARQRREINSSGREELQEKWEKPKKPNQWG